MDALDALKTRRSCRAYLDRPVDAQTLDAIIEAGRFAASGMGRQSVTFVAVTDPATVKQLSRMNAQIMGVDTDPFYGAQTVVVVLVDASVPTCVEDGALAMGNLMNAAHALGVDSCWIHRAREEFESKEGRAFGILGSSLRRIAARRRPLHPGLRRRPRRRAQTASRQRGVRKVAFTPQ